MSIINIVFASDIVFIPHLSAAIISLIKNNPESEFDIFIINSDIDRSNWEKLVSLDRVGKHRFHDLKISDQLFEGMVLGYHFKKQSYYRLLIPDMIQTERVVYLDSDIVVTGKISDLYNEDLKDMYLAAVQEPGFTRSKELEMSQESKYFNSGVLLMNLDLWRKDKIRDRVIEFIRKKKEIILFPDQDGMNAVINGRWKNIHPKYNMQSAFYEYNEQELADIYGLKELKEAKSNPVIVHYTGSIKPWHFYSNHILRNRYWYYRRKTPYKNDMLFIKNLIRKLVPSYIKRLVPESIKCILRKK
jgi:lipopolysaccharide biosynthesis glycosyltransferase